MVDDSQSIDWVTKLAELRARKGGVPPEKEVKWSEEHLLPDLGGPELDDVDKELDAFIERIDIIDAYNKWCGKMRPDPGSKREGIKISCPNPSHPDKNPSAWINLDKQTYYCAGCDEGGDIHDIAAYSFGYPVPEYKDGESFHKLREQMAESFGLHIKSVPGGKITWQEEPEKPKPVLQSVPEPSNVTPIIEEEDEAEAELVIYPQINWRNLIPEDTFLYEYMIACTNDDAPEEYHFWNGLLALGLVCGRKVTLDDTMPVYGNLLLCILGGTGTGKTRSRNHLKDVLEATAPFRVDGIQPTGVKNIHVPSSGEYLIKEFNYEGKDPSTNRSIGPQSVTGIVDFDELSALIARVNRQGSTIGPTIMQFADSASKVSTGSLTRGNFMAVDPFCTITASTQPRAIRTLVSRKDADSGFLNRWIFAGGKQKQIEALGGKRSNIQIDLSTAIEELKKIRGWGAIERSIEMDDDAYQIYLKFFRVKIEPTKLQDQTELLKRIDLTCKKLMLLLTINLRRKSVSVQIVRAVMEIYEYMLQCYGIINSNIGVTVMQDVVNDIEYQIDRMWKKNKGEKGVTANDIRKALKRKNYSLEQIKKALEVMTALNIIELAPRKSKVGKPTIQYKVVGE